MYCRVSTIVAATFLAALLPASGAAQDTTRIDINSDRVSTFRKLNTIRQEEQKRSVVTVEPAPAVQPKAKSAKRKTVATTTTPKTAKDKARSDGFAPLAVTTTEIKSRPPTKKRSQPAARPEPVVRRPLGPVQPTE